MSYVIIGNGTAAIGCIEGIRQRDHTGPITVLSTETHHCYARPLISYLLQGRTTLEHIKYRGDDFYEQNHVTFLPGTTVTKIDATAHTLDYDAGGASKTLPYKRLLIATGSRPFIPVIPGRDTLRYHNFLTLDDALRLNAALDAHKGQARVLIIGAGLIGTKCAEGIAAKAVSVTVVEIAARILPAVLDSQAADILQNHIEAAQPHLKFMLGRSIMALHYDTASHAGTVDLTDGSTVPFDELVVAVGVRPNTDLAAAAGAAVNRGICVTPAGAVFAAPTGKAASKAVIPDIYAAGDCTETTDISSGENRVLAILPNAYLQGEAAGLAMASGAAPSCKEDATLMQPRLFPLNASGFFGVHLVTAGSYIGEALEVPASAPVKNAAAPSPYYRKFFIRDDRLKGFIIMGDTARSGIYTTLIREQTPLSTIDFDKITLAPALMAFTKVQRQEILSAGVLT